MKNPQFGIWINDDDPADKMDKKSVGGAGLIHQPVEKSKIKRVKGH